MVIGACAGSTGGGTKVSRLVLMIKTAWNEIHHQLFPRSVGRITLDGERVEDKTLRSTMVFYVLYALVAFSATLLLSLESYDLETTLTSVISCLSNIGPGLNLVGPAGNYGFWSGGAKLLLCLCMLLGRLEIFPVIMLFAPGVWVGRKKQPSHFKGIS
jgi:trk system potassium uptake protein TrkH